MSNKKALIVVDMQNDYLWNRRKKMFSYNTPELETLSIVLLASSVNGVMM